MKYFLLLFMIGIIAFQTNSAFSACLLDPDWPEKPCLDTPPYSIEEQKEAWAPYYDHKGSQWMKMKIIEMEQAMDAGNLESWKQASSSNYNVWYYNSLFGDISQKEIDRVIPHDPYTDDERLRLASEKVFGGLGISFFNDPIYEISIIVIAILIGVGAAIGLTFYLGKRK